MPVADVKRLEQEFVNFLARFLSNVLDVPSDIRESAIHSAQLPMCAVGIQRVFSGKDEVTAIGSRQLKFLSDSHCLIGRSFRAQAAEDAHSVIDSDCPRVSAVVNRDCPGRTNLCATPRILPFFEIEAGPPTKVFGDLCRCAGICGRYDAGADRLLEYFEHRLPIRSRVRQIETL